jgi:hypothetical protein
MADSTTVQFIFGLDAPDLEEGDRVKFARQLLPELRQMDEVERADRLEDVISEAGAKGFATLAGWLTAEVSAKNIKGFLAWMGDRVADKPVKVKVKVGDREVELEAKSRQELTDLEPVAMKLIAALKGEPGA